MHRLTKKTGLTGKAGRILAVLLALTLAAGMLAGCVGKEEKSSGLKDKIKQSAQEDEGKKESGKKKKKKSGAGEEKKEEAAETAEAGVTPLEHVYVKDGYDYNWDQEYNEVAINYTYETICLGKESAEKYPELEKQLAVVNDLIVTEEANCYQAAEREYAAMDAETKSDGFDYGMLPYKQDWKVYARRADSAVFSVLTTAVTYSEIDYNDYRFVGYNYDPETGRELELSDVVADMDAFISLIADEVIDEMMEEIPDDLEYDKDDVIDSVTANLKEGARGNWTLDPEGVSVWFDSYTLLPTPIHYTLLFAEDEDGSLFTDTYRDKTPENWTMVIPLYIREKILSDDGKKPDYLIIGESYETYEEDDYEFIEGIRTVCNGDEDTFVLGDDIYDTGITLAHLNGKNVLLVQYKDYEWGFMDTFTIHRGRIQGADSIPGDLATVSWDELGPDDYALPKRVLTDPANFVACTYTDMLSTCSATKSYLLTEDGDFEPQENYYTIVEDAQYEITLKHDMSGLQMVDERRNEVMSTDVDLKKGDTFKMIYTDDSSYVDGLSADGVLVRIEVFVYPDEGGRYVKTDDGDIAVYEAFDDMKFAG
ncbi:MAG: hypothetical protein IKS87_02415 [Lachnospiraceae bacterium]|nr:hypothetical protein [Lachnospiraceae bacterium]